MIEREMDGSRTTISNLDIKRIEKLENWFRYEYPDRLNKINRYQYLGLKLPETRWNLELEAYDKENELRALKGLDKLPTPKLQNLF